MQKKLDNLKSDYMEFMGKSFNYFFCPILLRDEEVELCKAHIINQAFEDSSRSWTIQRKDVDNFYGSNFEADFLAIKYHESGSPGRVLIDKHLSRLFDPHIMIEDERIEHIVAPEDLPDEFSRLEFEHNGESIELGLKISPKNLLTKEESSWELVVSKDIRIAALISLIKAAHLTLFELLGYRYGLSTGGNFVGRHILGEFFLQNNKLSKSTVCGNALPFFREFAHLVRPVEVEDIDFHGTIADGKVLLCRAGESLLWGLIVFIRISKSLHAVLVPIFDNANSIAYYLNFLKNKDELINASYCIFNGKKWEVDKNTRVLTWPKKGTLYP